MELLITLARTLGFSMAAGVNLYATVAVLGLATRYGWVNLPEQYRIFDSDLIIGVALILYVIEFFADKIPWVDTLWDAVHTLIRPVGGAVLAVATLGEASPELQAAVALLGGTVAASSHFTKAGTRVIANASPEPFTNWILSIAEDIFVFTLGFITLKYPLLALAIVLCVLAAMIVFATVLIRAIRKRWQTPVPAAG